VIQAERAEREEVVLGNVQFIRETTSDNADGPKSFRGMNPHGPYGPWSHLSPSAVPSLEMRTVRQARFGIQVCESIASSETRAVGNYG
jgi:hypothetical protein